MSGRNIGHVEFIVDFDGDNLPRQAREIGNRAGKEYGDGLDEGMEDGLKRAGSERLSKFGERLREQMHENGRESGSEFGRAFHDSLDKNFDEDLLQDTMRIFTRENGFRDFASNLDSTSDAADNLDARLERLHRTGAITEDEFTRMQGALRNFESDGNRVSRAAEDQRNRIADLGDEVSRLRNEHLIRTTESFADLHDELRRGSRDFDLAKGEISELDRVFRGGRPELQRYADMWGTDLPGALDRFDRQIATSHQRFPALQRDFERLAGGSHLLRTGLTDTRSRFERVTDGMRRFSLEGRGAERMMRSIDSRVRNLNVSLPHLSHGLRQGVFYTGLFTALAPGIAALGSAAGSGLVALAVGAGALGLAVAAIIPGLKGMLGDIDKLPPKARGAAKAMQAFAEPLHDMQDLIQGNLWSGLGKGLDDLREKTLPRITTGMGKTAKTLNTVFDDAITRLTSPRTLGRLDKIFDGLQPVLGNLGGAILNLGAGLSTVFTAGIGSGQGFADFLNTTLGDWNKWLNDDTGRAALTTFFDHLGQIMPGVGTLIGAAGKSLASLVTDKSIDAMQRFLGTMTDALPEVVGGLGGLIDHLDPLNLVADALGRIGGGFASRAPEISAFGSAANDFIKGAGSTIGDVLGKVADAVLRIAPDVLENLSGAFDSLGKAVEDPSFSDALGDIGDALVDASEAIGDLVSALQESGAIGDSLRALGGAAKIAGAGIKIFDAAIQALTGHFDEAKKSLSGIDFGDVFKGAKNLGPGAYLNDMFDDMFNGGSDEDKATKKAKDKGKVTGAKLGGSFADGVNDGVSEGLDQKGGKGVKAVAGTSSLASGILSALGGLFDGEKGAAAREKGKSAGAKVKGEFSSGLSEGLAGGAEAGGMAGGIGGIVGNLFQDDGTGAAAARGAGSAAGGAFAGGIGEGVNLGKPGIDIAAGSARDSMVTPFNLAPTLIAGATGNIPGVIAGIMGLVTGQPGADNTTNPFLAAPGRVGANASSIPGVIAGIMGGVSGQSGADNTANPFAATPGRVSGFASSIPGVIAGLMGGVSGQAGADNTVTPFQGVPGRVGGHVSGVPGAVSGALAGVDDDGAASRIVSAFSGVPAAVGAALGGLGGVVSRALGAASSALSIGIAALPHASGTVTRGPEFALIGEAGPEAVVPLNRPLSKVDPSVRGLSAILQGKADLPAGEGRGGPNIEAGAIVVQAPNSDPEQVATAVLDRIIANS